MWIDANFQLPNIEGKSNEYVVGFSEVVWIYDADEDMVARAAVCLRQGGDISWGGDDDSYSPTDYYNVTHWQPVIYPEKPS